MFRGGITIIQTQSNKLNYIYQIQGVTYKVETDVVDDTLNIMSSDSIPAKREVYIKVSHDLNYYNWLCQALDTQKLTVVRATQEFNYLLGYLNLDDKEFKVLKSNLGYEDTPHIIIVRNKDDYEIISPSLNVSSSRFALRIIRENLLRDAENEGAVMVHAASLGLDGKGILICGNSGDGKTTFLSSMLLYAGAKYMSNDRTIIRTNRDGRMYASAYPLAMNLGLGTYQGVRSELDLCLEEVSRFHQFEHTLNKYQGLDWNDEKTIKDFWYNKEKIQLTTVEVEKAFKTDSIQNIPISLVIIPRLSHEKKELVVKNIDFDEVEQLIIQNIYTPEDPDFKDEWLALRLGTKSELNLQVEKFLNKIKGMNILSIECGYNFLDIMRSSKGDFIKKLLKEY
ncbi:hypothetical protein [Bacillus thuringiensis]|uniref:hypothetical protein n=1 Tax=Bacillus thuringiensis TaxID=1428 RepID=UPI0011A890A9|nr:hypothetical protein [Bacillus thuringiensis]